MAFLYLWSAFSHYQSPWMNFTRKNTQRNSKFKLMTSSHQAQPRPMYSNDSLLFCRQRWLPDSKPESAISHRGIGKAGWFDNFLFAHCRNWQVVWHDSVLTLLFIFFYWTKCIFYLTSFMFIFLRPFFLFVQSTYFCKNNIFIMFCQVSVFKRKCNEAINVVFFRLQYNVI